MAKVLSIDLLRIDAGTQSRVKINQDTVDDYAELIGASKEWPFPPVDVFHDGTDHMVADGFHRVLGGVQAKRSSVPCNVHKGTARDARIFGMTANDRHGLRMTRADKRACVEWLLDSGGKMTQAEIATAAGVSISTVRNIVTDRNPTSVSAEKQKRQIASRPPAGSTVVKSPKTEPSGEPAPAPVEGPAPDSKADYGKCPNCDGTIWDADEFGVSCAKCKHPHGEPATFPDEPAAKKRAGQPVIDSRKFKAFEQEIGKCVRMNTELRKHCNGPGKEQSESIRQHLSLCLEELAGWRLAATK